MDVPRELAFLRFDAEVRDHLDRLRDTDKALWLVTRTALEFFEADQACIALGVAGESEARLEFVSSVGGEWDTVLLGDFLAGLRPRVPRDQLFVPIQRYGRDWAVLALRRPEREFSRNALKWARRLSSTISRSMRRIDRLRTADVRSRIDRKIMEQLRPKDLFYQILRGLRSLLRYDHSASILIFEPECGRLEVVAEQITWRKGKSENIGWTVVPEEAVLQMFESGEVHGFDRTDLEWEEWSGQPVAALAETLDYNQAREEDGGQRFERSLLCAPLATSEGLLGVLRIASCHAGSLGAYEVDLVGRFLPQAAVAIRNLKRAESLELGMLEAERKHAVANLARGVAHDVNNTLGSMLPLVQQMQADLGGERFSRQAFEEDLGQLETSIQFCRRIFDGMLHFARGAAKGGGVAHVERALATTNGFLSKRMRRQKIELESRLEPELPAVAAGQSDLEQVVLNLTTNAVDAMPQGGTLSIQAVQGEGVVLLSIRDTGEGIEPDLLGRIQEPFFSTKSQGHGLGLAVCRSILWGMGGRIHFESQPGQGTLVTVRLPIATEEVSSS